MLQRMTRLRGSRVRGLDGEVGKLRDLYFDDAIWVARYLVVDVGHWPRGRRVLIAPEAVDLIDLTLHTVSVSLTRERIEESEELRRRSEQPHGDTHLRSAKEVSGYEVIAIDGRVGQVADFLFSDETWTVGYLVVETDIWPLGRRVLIASGATAQIEWVDKCVKLNVSRHQINSAPDFDPSARLPPDVLKALGRSLSTRESGQ